MRNTLPKREILRGKKSFTNIISSGNKIFEKNILCFYIIDEDSKIRSNIFLVGFTVNKKTGKAVVRNRIKRLLRESYRLNKSIIYETTTIRNFVVSMLFMYNSSGKLSTRSVNLHIVQPEIQRLLERVKQNLINRDSV